MDEIKISVPLGGNSFITDFYTGGVSVQADGWHEWEDSRTEFTVYFKSGGGRIALALAINPASDPAVISCTIGDKSVSAEIKAGDTEVQLGEWELIEGYTGVRIAGLLRNGSVFAQPYSLIASGEAAGSIHGYVREGDKDNYYWTRRGPSVHCTYVMPPDKNIEWFYNEVSTPKKVKAPIGTYAMAIGFDGGYCGIQVNSKFERRILFSVWSPYNTDNPADIPENLRIKLLGKNEATVAGQFGGEGSGGQSYIKYNWKEGVPQRFLMRVRPIANNSSEYSAYFYFPRLKKWQLIASFSRPETQSYIVRPHSFLENFSDKTGYITRKAIYANQYAVTSEGELIEAREMITSADATATAGNREDYAAGVEGSGFYLCNGGYFNDTTPPRTHFTREASTAANMDFMEFIAKA